MATRKTRFDDQTIIQKHEAYEIDRIMIIANIAIAIVFVVLPIVLISAFPTTILPQLQAYPLFLQIFSLICLGVWFIGVEITLIVGFVRLTAESVKAFYWASKFKELQARCH